MNDHDLDRMNGTHVMGCLSYRDDPDTGYPYDCDCEDGQIDRPTPSDMRRLFVLWREAGLDTNRDRALRLHMTGEFVGREVTSTNDLSPGEAHRLVEYMTGKHHAGQLGAIVDNYRSRQGVA